MSRKKLNLFHLLILAPYIQSSHKVILKVLSGVINFVFKTKVRKRIGFSKTFIYRTSNVMGERYFTKQTLISAMCSHRNKCFFTIGNIVFKQDIGISMGIDPLRFWANLFL